MATRTPSIRSICVTVPQESKLWTGSYVCTRCHCCVILSNLSQEDEVIDGETRRPLTCMPGPDKDHVSALRHPQISLYPIRCCLQRIRRSRRAGPLRHLSCDNKSQIDVPIYWHDERTQRESVLMPVCLLFPHGGLIVGKTIPRW